MHVDNAINPAYRDSTDEGPVSLWKCPVCERYTWGTRKWASMDRWRCPRQCRGRLVEADEHERAVAILLHGLPEPPR